MTVAIVCTGTVSFTTDGAPLCSTGWETLQYEAVVPFNYTQLNPAELSLMFAGGFFVILPVWAACYGLKKLVGLI